MTKGGLLSAFVALIIGVYLLGFQNRVSSELSVALGQNMAAQQLPDFGSEPSGNAGPAATGEGVAETSHSELPPSDFVILNAKGHKLSRKAASALLRPYDLTRERSATLMSFVDPQTLLREGEDMPTGELLDLMVEVRSAAIADQACRTLLTTVAAQCGVKSYKTVRIGKLSCDSCDAQDHARRAPFVGHYQITTEMAYAPKEPVGVFPEAERVMFQEKTFDLEAFDLADPDSGVVDERFAFIVSAANRACEDIKSLHGNCVISNLKLAKRIYIERSDFDDIPNAFTLSYFTAVTD